MIRTVCRIGAAQAVPVPKEVLEKLKLKVGSKVDIDLDEKNCRILIRPAVPEPTREVIDRTFALQVDDFIKRYGPAIKSLSRK